MNKLFQEAYPILDKIVQAGYEAYFVGGSVRDHLLQKKIHDIDIATSATPDEVKDIFPNTVDIGIQHGTVMVIWNQQTYEITTFRSESSYINYRKPSEVTFIRSLLEDLKRRDFTMNAMAMNRNGEIIDYFDGKSALKYKKIVTVGKASERFSEDALRMMRAVRFISTLGFSLEEETKQAIVSNRHLLKEIAVERITSEFEKLLQGEERSNAVSMMVETALYEFLPFLTTRRKELELAARLDTKHLLLEEMWALLLLLLELEEKKDGEKFLRAWKLSNKQMKRILSIVKCAVEHDALKKWTNLDLYSYGFDLVCSVEKIQNTLEEKEVVTSFPEIRKQYDHLPIRKKEDLVINGQDIIRWSNKPAGPWIKNMFSIIEKAVLENKVANEKQALKEWLKSVE